MHPALLWVYLATSTEYCMVEGLLPLQIEEQSLVDRCLQGQKVIFTSVY